MPHKLEHPNPTSSMPVGDISGGSSANGRYDSDELPKLVLNLERLQDLASSALSAPCTKVGKLTRGYYREISTLYFSGGNHPTCIARFIRPQPPGPSISSYATSAEYISTRLQSEVDTMRYLSAHTSVPVPEIFLVCKDANGNGVGAPFILMQHIPGQDLYKLWPSLSAKHKMYAVWQIAEVVAQLGALEFEAIGSLMECTGGGPEGSGEMQTKVGELIHTIDRSPHMSSDKRGPFQSTTDYLVAFVNCLRRAVPISRHGDLDEIQECIKTFLENEEVDDFRSPFGLEHAEFDGENMLFVVGEGGDDAPKLSGIIDWEYARTAPRYFIYDYPLFIQNNPYEKEAWPLNKLLRQHFVRGVLHHSPPLAAPTALCSFRRKIFLMNEFVSVFMFLSDMDPDTAEGLVKHYLIDVKEGTGEPYGDWEDFEQDTVELGLEHANL